MGQLIRLYRGPYASPEAVLAPHEKACVVNVPGPYESDTGQSASLVLVDRSVAVGRAVAAAHPRLRTRRTTMSSRSGMSAGRAAADRAVIGGRGVGSGQRRALGS